MVEGLANVSRVHGVLGSLLSNFDMVEIRPRVDTAIVRSKREFAVVSTYLRSHAQIRTLIDLASARHFQAAASIARSVFELAVDIRLIDKIQDGADKFELFSEVEKLRVARRICGFYSANVDVQPEHDLGVYEKFVTDNAASIEAEASQLWPTIRVGDLKHWSQRHLHSRATFLGSPFDEIYDVHYAELSWYAHPGFGAIATMDADAYAAVCGIAYGLASRCYYRTLLFMIGELKLNESDPHIEKKLEFVALAPFAKTAEDALSLRKAMLGY